jgi:HK97 gp10 family phage protein
MARYVALLHCGGTPQPRMEMVAVGENGAGRPGNGLGQDAPATGRKVMARTQIKIEGMKELRGRISRLDGKLQRKVYRQAVRKAGVVVVNAAKAQVPVRTGSIKRSLTHRTNHKLSQGLFGVKVTIRGGRKASERTANRRGKGSVYHPDAVERYYRFQELGTKHHPAKPFLKPALEGKAGEVLEVLKRELAAGLEREVRSL